MKIEEFDIFDEKSQFRRKLKDLTFLKNLTILMKIRNFDEKSQILQKIKNLMFLMKNRNFDEK